MDPNSANQLWSRWTFTVREAGRRVPRADVEYNAAKWLRAGFGSAGQVRVRRTVDGWAIDAMVEGVPAHEPGYVAHVTRQFRERFVAQGWGVLASGDVAARVLAGDVQDGKPRAQLVMLPALRVRGTEAEP
jgi:hypothetical protein